jgi:ATP-binding protein involved in chromosome partitioning
MDADIYGPNIPTMMGVLNMPTPRNDKLQPAVAYDVKVISMGYLVKPGQPLIWRGPMLNSAIRQFISDVEWGELDYLIIDLPPGTGDAPLSLAQALPLSGVVIVTMPQGVSLEDASRGLEMFNTLNVPILGVIENMSYLTLPDGSRMDVFGQGGGKAMAAHYNVPFLGAIPLNPNVRIGGDTGKPIVITEPESDSAKALLQLAESVAARISLAALNGTNAPSIDVI